MNAPQHHPSASGGRTEPFEPYIHRTASVAFGEFLRRAREGRGLTLQQIANETKIPRRHLESLEYGNLAAVPGGMYRRGEVIAFAKVVGLDRNVALAHLERALGPIERGKASIPEPAQTRDAPNGSRLALPRLAAAGAFALAAMFVALMSTRGATQLPKPLETLEPNNEQRRAEATSAAAPLVQTAPLATAATAPRVTPPDQPAMTRGPADVPAEPAATRRDTVREPTDVGGKLVIITEPAGARVTVDGIGWGFTPLSVENLPPGAKRIRVTRDGYSAVQRTVRLPETGATTIRIPLHEAQSPQRQQ